MSKLRANGPIVIVCIQSQPDGLGYVNGQGFAPKSKQRNMKTTAGIQALTGPKQMTKTYSPPPSRNFLVFLLDDLAQPA